MMESSTSTEYDCVLIVDLDPQPNYPHASVEAMKDCGLDPNKLKLSRNFRLRAMRLPIYEDEHLYHVVAKIDKRCSTNDKNNARRSVNEHIANAKRAKLTMDAIMQSVVEAFPSRVVKGLNYDANNEPQSKYGTSNRLRVNTKFSSSDTDCVAAS